MIYINELYHHGIKGQKWGVRRYQNSDGTLTAEGKRRYASGDDYTIPKNSKFYRTAFNNPNGYNPKRGRVYVSTNTEDNNAWEKIFREEYAGYPLYSVTMKSVKDIKVAGTTALGEAWYKKMSDDPEFTNQVISDLVYTKLRFNLNVLNSEDGSFGYGDFAKTLGYGTKSANDFFKEMGDMGYDAISDYFGRNVSEEPLILLDADKSIAKVKVSQLT